MSISMLGVLGGLGPLATVDFLGKMVALTPATCDQEHFPWTVVSLPETPDRTASILSGDDAPLPYLLSGIRRLNGQDARAIAILCNTAHHWYGELQKHSHAPILHIADAVISALADCQNGMEVAILATRGTIISGFYQQKLIAAGFRPLILDEVGHQDHVDECIRLVKAHHLEEAAVYCQSALDVCARTGCGAVIMGCTEIPVACQKVTDKHHMKIVDANLELARVCVEHFKRKAKNVPASPAA